MQRWTIAFGLLLLLTGGFPQFVHADTPTVFFRELMWAGTDRSTADEWVVLANASSIPLSLDGWRLTRLSGGAEVTAAELDGLLIAAHGSLLIASHDQHHPFTNGESALAIDPDVVVRSLSLSNTTLQLKLYGPDRSAPVDVAGNGQAPPAGQVGSTSKGQPWLAMERVEASLDGTLKASWVAAANRHNLDVGVSTFALPDHAGRPTVVSTSLPPLPAGQSSATSVVVADPDGDDDIASVALDCPDGRTELADTGLGGDRRAGDRQYTALIHPSASGSVPCTATVADRSGLGSSQVLTRSTYVRTAHVVISELLPNPAEGDEWIELRNLESNPVDLTSWQLDDRADGGSHPFTLTQVIPANGYLVIPASQSKLALNNDGDEVSLANPEGSVIDTTHYRSAKRGQAWADLSGEWAWVSQLTPGAVNLADPPALPPTSALPPAVSVATFTSLASETVVQLTGRVVALPGTLSSRSWLLDDGTGVAEVYLAHGDFAALPLGGWVSVIGRRSSVSQPRLLLDAGTTDPVTVPAQTILPRSLVDALTRSSPSTTFVTGHLTLAKVNTKTATATIGDRTLTLAWSVLLPNQTFSPTLVAGQPVTVTGVLTTGDTSSTLTLRSLDDLAVEPVLAAAAAAPSPVAASESATTNPITPDWSVRRRVEQAVARIDPVVTTATVLARLVAEQTWLTLANEATVLNQALTNQLVTRRVRRLTWWRRLDQSAIVGLALSLFLLHGLISWQTMGRLGTDPLYRSGG